MRTFEDIEALPRAGVGRAVVITDRRCLPTSRWPMSTSTDVLRCLDHLLGEKHEAVHTEADVRSTPRTGG